MINISFNFNEKTHQVSNITVVELKDVSDYDVQVCENKLLFSNKALDKLGVVPGDRIVINYWMGDKSKAFPIISKADVFDNGEDGTKLTKGGTISFKGQQRITLLKFGSYFTLDEFVDKNGNVKDNVFKLSPVIEDDTVTEEEVVKEEELSIDEMNQSELEDELAEMLEENEEDILPF